jgi:restriction system protein
MNKELISLLTQVVEQIPVIDSGRQYWFIRTNGGEFFDDFLNTGSVGIGYNLVRLAKLNEFKRASSQTSFIASEVKEAYPDHTNANQVAGLLSRFLFEMKAGDIVVMPSESSWNYAFGEVTEKEPFEESGPENLWNDLVDKAPFRKRRRVEWIKVVNRGQIDSKLYGAFRAPQTLSKANEYADFIDREINDIYTKNGKTYVKIRVNTPERIQASDFFGMGIALLELSREFSEDALDEGVPQIDVRSNVQSQGMLQFIGEHPLVMAWLASLVVLGTIGGGILLIGGHAKFNVFGQDIDLQTDGLIKKIQDFLSVNTQREITRTLLLNNMRTLDVRSPEEMLQILTPGPTTAPPQNSLPQQPVQPALNIPSSSPAQGPMRNTEGTADSI